MFNVEAIGPGGGTPVACVTCPLRDRVAFKAYERDQIDFIQSIKVAEATIPARGTILREGERSSRVSTLLEGWAFRYKTLPDGRRQILNFLLPGDLVGLQARLFEEAQHGVEALTDVRLCVFARERIWQIYRQHPELAYDVTWLAAREESFVDEGLLTTGRRTAVESMAAMFLHFWQRGSRLGIATDAGMRLPLTQTHIADFLGLSPVHTSRTLRRLRERRLLAFDNGTLRDVDLPGLRRLASAYEADPAQRPLI